MSRMVHLTFSVMMICGTVPHHVIINLFRACKYSARSSQDWLDKPWLAASKSAASKDFDDDPGKHSETNLCRFSPGIVVARESRASNSNRKLSSASSHTISSRSSLLRFSTIFPFHHCTSSQLGSLKLTSSLLIQFCKKSAANFRSLAPLDSCDELPALFFIKSCMRKLRQIALGIGLASKSSELI